MKMKSDERKTLALKILKEIDDVTVAPGCEQLKVDMQMLLEDIAMQVIDGEEVEV
jgi:hypothetical protein